MGPLWSVVLNGLSAVQEGLAEGDYANGRPDFAIHSDVLPELGRELYFTPSPCFYSLSLTISQEQYFIKAELLTFFE